MPFTVTLTHAPPLLRLQARPRRRLRTIADAALEAFVTLWLGLFRDVRAALTFAALKTALESSTILEARALLDRVWLQAGDIPARRLVPGLAMPLLEDAATATLPLLRALAGQPVTFVPGLPETQQWLSTYTGEQIRDIGATTLATLRTVLREGWQADTTPTVLARRLRMTAGLTPRQSRTIAAMQAHMVDEGQSPAQITAAVERATQIALQRRAQVLAATQTHTTVQAGPWQALQQAIRAGVLDGTRVRRYWQVAAEERACRFCTKIPALNPEGVGPSQPFLTLGEPVMFPGLHPCCRCDVDHEYVT